MRNHKLIYILMKTQMPFMAYTLLLFAVTFYSCEEFTEIEPPTTQIVNETVFTDDASATAAIRGIYSEMINITAGFANGGSNSITFLTGLSSDEFTNHSTSIDREDFYSNSILSDNSIIPSYLFGEPYKFIFYANSVLEGLTKSSGVTTSTKAQLEGEAKFVRAFCYFYLINLFGDVPLINSTDFRVNSTASRSSVAQVYQQIIADLQDAQILLTEDYSFSKQERIRPNKSAATALLSRVYLYMEEWANAETQATTIIDNQATYNLAANLNDVFLANSTEAIWQLMPNENTNYNTNEGNEFILLTAPTNVSVSEELLNAFEPNDERKIKWIGNLVDNSETYFFPFKYKIDFGENTLMEYSMVLRLAEQYLIRSEARAQLNDIAGSQNDLNVIRNRSGLPNTIANDQASLLLAIEQERRVEFFAEWGHRWLDLNRTDRAHAVLGLLKGGDWQSADVLYPIPQSDIENNPNLTQNPGY